MPPPDDEEAWRQVAQTVKPFPGRQLPGKNKTPSGVQKKSSAAPMPPVPSVTKNSWLLPLVCGEVSALDGRLAERFLRGQLPIDATLDLHGLRLNEAEHAVGHFLAAHKDKSRCLLVITGKGRAGEGVIRAQIPRWLNETHRPSILAFCHAKAQHGGSGAFYVLLKRKR